MIISYHYFPASSRGYRLWPTAKYPIWQYNGVAKFSVIVEWCEENLKDRYLADWETIYFKSDKDAMWFQLRWS